MGVYSQSSFLFINCLDYESCAQPFVVSDKHMLKCIVTVAMKQAILSYRFRLYIVRGSVVLRLGANMDIDWEVLCVEWWYKWWRDEVSPCSHRRKGRKGGIENMGGFLKTE